MAALNQTLSLNAQLLKSRVTMPCHNSDIIYKGQKKACIHFRIQAFLYLVPKARIELARVTPLRPQHSVSTSSTTSAIKYTY